MCIYNLFHTLLKYIEPEPISYAQTYEEWYKTLCESAHLKIKIKLSKVILIGPLQIAV